MKDRLLTHLAVLSLTGLALLASPEIVSGDFSGSFQVNLPDQIIPVSPNRLMDTDYLKLATLPTKGDPLPNEDFSFFLRPELPFWIGRGTTYSTEGCLNCSSDLRMANGQPLDDSRLTIAFMRAPLGSWVTIENLQTGQKVTAQVTDRGGFEAYGRLVDATPAVSGAIGMKTDVTPIKVTLLPSKT